jgi:aspartate aminotransferase-like enzyme
MKSVLFIPGPVALPEPVLAALARPMIDHRGPEFAALLARLEGGLQAAFGTTGDVVILGGSGTAGLEAAVSSAFSPGDRVLACPIGVFGKRLASIARTYGLNVDVLETAYGSALDPAALRERLATGGHYDGILLTQNETSTGSQNDMAALARAIGDNPALIIVDAVSGLAASEFRMGEWGFDIVVAASQKALAAPPGVTMIAVSKRAWERIERSTGPSFYLNLTKARTFARDGQTPWTPPVPILFALDAALELYERAGPTTVWERHARYAEAIRAAAAALGLQALSQPGAHSPTVVAIAVPGGVDAAAVTRDLRDRHGIVISGGQQELRGKIWRIGTMGALDDDDILRAVSALEGTLRTYDWSSGEGVAVAAASRVLRAREAVAQT